MAAIDWEPWLKILQSETFWIGLGTAAIGSLAGAWGGAWAIQRITDKAKIRETMRRDVVRTNAAIELVFMHITKFLNLKEQFTVPMIAEYDAIDTIVHAYEAGLNDGTIPQGTPPPALPPLNMFSISRQDVRVERLEKIILEDLTVTGRARALVGTLEQSIDTLNMLLEEREKMMSALKAAIAGGMIRRKHMAFMFGLPQPNGGADLTFKTNVRGIVSTNDECIHFSLLMYRDLYAHGERAREKYLERFRGPIPEISELDFSKAKAKGLFPDPTPFVSWESGFVTRMSSTSGQRVRKSAYWLRKKWRSLKRAWKRSAWVQRGWWWLKRIVLVVAGALLVIMMLREIAVRLVLPTWRWALG